MALSKVADTKNTALSINEEWFAADFNIPSNKVGHLHFYALIFSISVASKIQISYDSGSTWKDINDGANFPANAIQVISIPITAGANFQIRAAQALTITNGALCSDD